MKIVTLCLLLSLGLFAESLGLFGKVVNVSENDTLNVRTQANYRAQKVGELPPSALVGIESCKKVKNSTWCKIYQLVQNNYYESSQRGWVNAKYLKFKNRGYVNIEGKYNHCFYALKCENRANTEKCLVVFDYTYDYKKEKMIERETQWIKRDKLQGESAFGAMSNNKVLNPEGGYCTNPL